MGKAIIMTTSSIYPTSNISPPFGNNGGQTTKGHRLHPFPARMAPEIIMEAVDSVPSGSTVLDTMCGSGTVLRESVWRGHRAIGFDVDPLAVLISRVSTRHIDLDLLIRKAETVANKAASMNGNILDLPWIDRDEETKKFVEFWFGTEQRSALRSLACLVSHIRGPIGDALKLALSKIIITKEPRASLARDTSHSRPHRVVRTSDYDAIEGFRKAVIDIRNKLTEDELSGTAIVRRADARRLPPWLSNKADLVITSPPYGNAIDYLRGHRLSLVWLGYPLPQIKAIKANSIGRQAGFYRKKCPCVSELTQRLGHLKDLPLSTQRRLSLFVQDIYLVMNEIHRSLVPHGHAILVVGNSMIDGKFLDNANMIVFAAEYVGLMSIARYCRDIPGNHRYLPPPKVGSESALSKRMREEVILTFEKT